MTDWNDILTSEDDPIPDDARLVIKNMRIKELTNQKKCLIYMLKDFYTTEQINQALHQLLLRINELPD